MTIGAIGGANLPDPSTMRSNMAQMDKTIAGTLKMSVSDLRSALKSGQTLGDLASSQGVSKDDLVKSIADTISKNAPAGMNMTADGAKQIATNIVDGKGPGGPQGPGGLQGPGFGQQVQGHHHKHRHHSTSSSATSSDATGSTSGTSGTDTTATDLAELLLQRQSAGL
jgi:hypothetical protein